MNKLKLDIQSISKNDLQKKLSDLTVLRMLDDDRIKVAAAGNTIYKCFYNRRKFPGKIFKKPAGICFVLNAVRLEKVGVHSIKCSSIYYCDEANCYLIAYDKLAGNTVYDHLHSQSLMDVLPKLAKYIAFLHQQDVYFRAGHADNYLYNTQEKKFSIIDIDNLRFNINLRQRARNLFYLFNHAHVNQSPLFEKYTFPQFIEQYLIEAKLSKLKSMQFIFWLNYYLKKKNYDVILSKHS